MHVRAVGIVCNMATGTQVCENNTIINVLYLHHL